MDLTDFSFVPRQCIGLLMSCSYPESRLKAVLKDSRGWDIWKDFTNELASAEMEGTEAENSVAIDFSATSGILIFIIIQCMRRQLYVLMCVWI